MIPTGLILKKLYRPSARNAFSHSAEIDPKSMVFINKPPIIRSREERSLGNLCRSYEARFAVSYLFSTTGIYRSMRLEDKTLVRSLKNLSHQRTFDATSSSLETVKRSVEAMGRNEVAQLLNYLRNSPGGRLDCVWRFVDDRLEKTWCESMKQNKNQDLGFWLFAIDSFLLSYRVWTKTRSVIHELFSFHGDRMTNSQLIHLLYLHVMTKRSSLLPEKYLKVTHDVLKGEPDFDAVVVICLVFFRGMMFLKSPDMADAILDHLIRALPGIRPDQPSFSSVIKCIRYSKFQLENRDKVVDLIDKLHFSGRHILHHSYFNIIQTVKLMEAFRVYNEPLLDNFKKDVFENMRTLRIKEIQYALTSLSNFAYQDLEIDSEFRSQLDRLCDDIISEKRSDAEMQYFHLASLMRALSVLNYYNEKMTDYYSYCLSRPDIYDRMKDALEFNKSVLLYYASSHIEAETGLRIPDRSLLKHLVNSITKQGNFGPVLSNASLKEPMYVLSQDLKATRNSTRSELIRALAKDLALSQRLRNCDIRFEQTFPHMSHADLIITRGSCEMSPLDIRTFLPRRVPDNARRCVLHVQVKYDFVDFKNRLGGHKRLMTRLYQKLGYTPFGINVIDDKIVSANVISSIKSELGV